MMINNYVKLQLVYFSLVGLLYYIFVILFILRFFCLVFGKQKNFYYVNEVLIIIVGVRNYFIVIGVELKNLLFVFYLYCIENINGEFKFFLVYYG